MNSATTPNAASWDANRSPVQQGPALRSWRNSSEWRSLEARQFPVIEHALDAHCGLITGEDLTSLARGRFDQPLSVIAKWIVGRTIMSLVWRGQTLIPVFQFDLRDLSVRPPVQEAAAELRPIFDDWELVLWFCQPNGWLRNSAPVDHLHAGDDAVLQAARADRFVARG